MQLITKIEQKAVYFLTLLLSNYKPAVIINVETNIFQKCTFQSDAYHSQFHTISQFGEILCICRIKIPYARTSSPANGSRRAKATGITGQ